ncbi:unnamed protein product [Tuber melanosporum]|uniref:(Perigord truffle) hypothetical protein n=1 Tax=Tuber melanosporum (strain Mel28) TaxID=656061 RepID=D5GDK7_TUBMM|nr:uncharacterized protein GSTUM_00001062001 [Tuber melanosporum]CAZ82600.1 unnamed protein product [Tuber melanosporum]
MGFKLCCCCTNLWSSPRSPPAQPPPGQTPDLPTLPDPVAPDVSSAIKISTVPEKREESTAPETILPPANPESSTTPDPGNKETSSPARVHGRATNTDMVSNSRTPLGAWHAVAAKVVAANRFRGAGVSSHVGDFRIEELGGKGGHLVFGPVAVFNGNVSLGIKKPMTGMTLTITFTGAVEVDKNRATFLSISHELHSGGRIPHIPLRLQLSPSQSPTYIYEPPNSLLDDNSSIGSRILEFKSKPLEIVFIPYIDPALEFPPLPRLLPQVFPSKDKNSKGKGVDTAPSLKSVSGAESPTNSSDIGPLKVPKPKLTLTTAELPLTASSNSTPIIDKPRPIDTSVLRTVCMTDDGKIVARLTIELQKTRFLPDDEISLLMQFAIKEGDTMPKGFGIRVVEKRCLARMDPDIIQDEAAGDDDEDSLPKLNVIGKERTKVLTGGKFAIHPDNIRNVKLADLNIPDRTESAVTSREKGDEPAAHRNLLGGKKIEMPIRIRLPSFKTFISDILLPTVALPLGSLSACDPAPRIGPIDGIPSSSPPSSTHRNNKGKSPMVSSTPSPTTPASSINHNLPLLPPNLGLSFIVAHVLQVTVPTSTSWLKKPTSISKDLEISIPIVLGNINPHAALRRKAPDFRMSVLEERRYGVGGSSSSRSSSRKGSVGSVSGYGVASGSGGGGGGRATGGWREGERFLTLKETEIRPGFIGEF